MEKTREVYEAPSVVELGSVEELTHAATTGGHLDAPFPSGAQNSSLTFSG